MLKNSFFRVKSTYFGNAHIIKFSFQESISRCYKGQVALMTSEDVDTEKLLKKSLIIEVSANIDNKQHKNTRYFSGEIIRIRKKSILVEKKVKHFLYNINFAPKLWYLSLSNKFSMFENQSIANLIEMLMHKNKISNFENKFSGYAKEKLPYLAQYDESDLAFIQRLLGSIGAFYYFQHGSEGEILKFCDNAKDFMPAKSSNFMNHKKQPIMAGDEVFMDVFQDISVISNLKGPNIRAIDRDFTQSNNFNIEGNIKSSTDYLEEKIPTGLLMEDNISKINIENLIHDKSNCTVVEGSSTITSLMPGLIMENITPKHPKLVVSAVNHSFSNNYILEESYQTKEIQQILQFLDTDNNQINNDSTDASYNNYRFDSNSHNFINNNLSTETVYKNSFKLLEVNKPISPPFKEKRIYGTEMAIVVGPNGKTKYQQDQPQVYTDKFGRIKIRFMWQNEIENEKSPISCWVRVTQQLTAGKNTGTLFIPHIGDEVVVAFNRGDPNRPIVVGSVYNVDNYPPYLPKYNTRNTIKTLSIGGKKSNDVSFNELRFENNYEKEEVFIHAAKDYLEVIQNSQSSQIKQGDKKITLDQGSFSTELLAKGDEPANYNLTLAKGNIEQKIENDGNMDFSIKSGSHTLDIKKGNAKTTLHAGNQHQHLHKGDFALDLDHGNYNLHIKNGNQEIKISGAQEIHIGKNQTSSIQGDHKMSIQGDMHYNVMGGMKITTLGSAHINAAAPISLKSEAKVSIEGMAGIDIKTLGELNLSGSIVNITSNISMSISATCMTINANAALNISSAGVANIVATGALSSSAATMALNAGMIALNGVVAIG